MTVDDRRDAHQAAFGDERHPILSASPRSRVMLALGVGLEDPVALALGGAALERLFAVPGRHLLDALREVEVSGFVRPAEYFG